MYVFMISLRNDCGDNWEFIVDKMPTKEELISVMKETSPDDFAWFMQGNIYKCYVNSLGSDMLYPDLVMQYESTGSDAVDPDESND